MPIDFRRLMTPEQRARLDAQKEFHARDLAEARAMDDETLANKIEYFMTQSTSVRKWAPGDPVYDAVLVYSLIPEAARRLRKRAQ